MRTILIFVLALILTTPFLQAQHDHDHFEGEICGTMQNLEILKQQDPGLEERMAQIERLTSQWIQNRGDGQTEGGDAVITIPVVVHILYNSSFQNISDAQVMSQIDVLNKDFRRMNTDTSLTPAIFKPFAADPGIEFCLASRDPQGNFTTGITRTQTSVSTFNQMNNNAKYTSMGGKDAWPASAYLNIWVCNLSSGLLGYAQFPGSNPATDGVVIHYTAFGTMGTASAPYNKGRTTTHEIGHWLNLYHIWGDDNGACTGTDYVGDTPNQGNNYYGCPSHPQVSCGSEDMFMNYMDYANDACSNVFTQGQKDRMQAAVSIWRSSLQFSQGCLTQAPLADFSVDNALTTAGCAVNFTDLSVGPPQSWQWIFENGQPATSNVQNPQAILFNQPGSWDVTLVVHNALGYDTLFMPDLIIVSDTLRPEPQFTPSRKFVCTDEAVYFVDQSKFCPISWQWQVQPESYSFVNGTGSASQHPVIQFHAAGEYHVTLVVGNLNGQRSLTHVGLIRAGGLPLPFNEDFEGNSFTLREWTIENPNNDFTWQIQQAPSAQTSNLAASVQIFGTNSFARRDAMISAPLNLSTYSTAYLSFRHAYAQYQPQFSDSLIVLVSGDCGLTWTTVFRGGDNGSGNWATSAPNTSSFVPAGPDDWCWSGYGSPCYSIDLSAWAGQENVKVKFESVSSLSNNIYLDDIQISDVLSTTDLGSYDKAVHIYPNPSTGSIHLRTEGLSGKFLLRLNNLHGSTVLEEVLLIDQKYYLRSYNLSALPKGMYLMNLVGDSQNYTGKVILR